MDKYELIRRIEKFAPPETAEPWDCSGWLVETENQTVSKIMLALTVTDDIVSQARKANCGIILAHHPLFNVPLSYKEIDIYCAHTNLDLAEGGTTDTLISRLGLKSNFSYGFVRYVIHQIEVNNLIEKLKIISPNLRYTNPQHITTLNKIAVCAGSGSEFIAEAAKNGADAFITGDLKFHTALDSQIAVFDIGHFESEIPVLNIFKNIIGNDAEVLFAEETSPFIVP